MPDFFGGEEEIFRGMELGAGLNEGDIKRAIEKIDEEIARERELEDAETSANLGVITHPGINPDVAAKYGKNIGLPFTTGDQLKEAKPILKRLQHAYDDRNLDPGIREETIQRDLADLDQITLRSTMQGGRRGVAVTGKTLSGRKAEELRGFESEPLLEPSGEFTISPEGKPIEETQVGGRFFPEPTAAPGDDVESFISSLEPEDTLLGGAAGQREIAQIRQRNAIRISEMQAGQEIFETAPGQAKRLGGVPPRVPAVKGPSTIESALLQPGLSDERKEELIGLKLALKGKGYSGRIKLPDGTEISIGEGDDIGKLTPGAKTQIQKEIRDAQGRIQEFNNIATSPQFDPNKNLTFYRAGLASFGSFLDEIDPSVSDFFDLQDNVKDFAAFKSLTENLFTAWRRSVTGVAFRPEEEKALRKAFPSTKDGPTEFKAKLKAVKELNNRIVNRLQTLRPGDKIDVLNELSGIQGSRTGDELDLNQFKR
jgi:hypothetical protein